MPSWLITVFSILIFIVSISALIFVHELGHYVVAKSFKVYVHEFAIGFGPKIIRKQPKGKETFWSLRAIPFGGFCSMFDEPEDSVEFLGYELPKERTMSGRPRWQRILILIAGIAMNFTAALGLFFVNNVAFTQHNFFPLAVGSIDVGSPADIAGISLFQSPSTSSQFNSLNKAAGFPSSLAIFSDSVTYTYPSEGDPLVNETETVYLVMNTGKLDFTQNNKMADAIQFHREARKSIEGGGDLLGYPESRPFAPLANSNVKFTFNMLVPKFSSVEDIPSRRIKNTDFWETNADGVFLATISNEITLHSEETGLMIDVEGVPTPVQRFESIGITSFIHQFRFDFGGAIVQTFVDWGEGFTAIGRTIGRLFAADAEVWGQIGGPIAIFNQTDQILRSGRIGMLFQFWGLISVNLGLINLLPIPGLDGGQIIFLLIEMIARRDINKKVKQWINLIGMVLMLLLMGVIFFKDIVSCFSSGALMLLL